MLSYRIINGGKHEWVVFLHGIGGSRKTFTYQIEDFSTHYNLVLLDLHGHGESVHHKLGALEKPSLDAVAVDVLAALDELKIEKAHFVGMSSGTMIQTALANLAPERILSLVLSGAAIKFRPRAKVLIATGNMLRHVVPRMVLYRLFAWIMMPRSNHRRSRSIFIREAAKMPAEEFYIWFDLTQRFEKDYPLERHTAPPVPKLYILGEEDHMLAPLTAKYAGMDKGAGVHIIPRCGHVCNIDDVSEFNRAALSFMARHSFFKKRYNP